MRSIAIGVTGLATGFMFLYSARVMLGVAEGCRSSTPSLAASAPTVPSSLSSAPLSIRRKPRATVVREPFQAGENGAVSGRCRSARHPIKPAGLPTRVCTLKGVYRSLALAII